MNPQHEDYLGRLAFREGEYERLEEAFDNQVEHLAAFLGAAVETRLQSQVRGEVSSHWSSTIRQLAQDLFDSVPEIDAPLSKAQAGLRAELQNALAQADWPDQSVLKREAQACSREISQLILARWFEVLHQGLRDQESLALTPNVLPDGMTLHQTLEEIDLANHGIDELTMSSAWRSYWEVQTSYFRKLGVPIELGSSLFLVAGRLGSVDAYLLFSNEESAKMNVAMQLQAMNAPLQGPRIRIAEVVAHMAETIRTTVTRIGIPTSSKTSCLALQEGWGRALRVIDVEARAQPRALSTYRAHLEAAKIFGAQDDAPERLFATIVGQGLDVMFACSRFPEAVSAVEFGRCMPLPAEELRQALVVYANSRAINVADAADLYAASVAGSWACNVEVATEFAANSATCVFDPYDVFFKPGESRTTDPAISIAHAEAAAAAHLWSKGVVQVNDIFGEYEVDSLDSSWSHLHERG